MTPTVARHSRRSPLVGLTLAAGLLVVACGGDDDSAAMAPATDATEVPEATDVTEVTDASDATDGGDDGAPAPSGDGGALVADWVALNEAYDAADTSDPFSDESDEALAIAISEAFSLVPDTWPVPEEVNQTASRGFSGWPACVSGRTFNLDLVDSEGVGIAGGADRADVMALFEEAFDDGSWEVEFEDDFARVYRVVHDGAPWRLVIKDSPSGENSALDFCPTDE